MADGTMLHEFENFCGNTQLPDDFTAFWQGTQMHCANAPCNMTVSTDMAAGDTVFSTVRYNGIGTKEITARYLAPKTAQPRAIVLDFHDAQRTTRGAFYLARYAAIGCSVLAPAALPLVAQGGFSLEGTEKVPQDFLFFQIVEQAFLAAEIAKKLAPDVPLFVSGEGFGGALALAVAAFVPQVVKCAVLNPLLADFRTLCACGADIGFYASLRSYFRDSDPLHQTAEALFSNLDYFDTVNFAAQIKGALFCGTGLLDEISPAKTQYALFHRAKCVKTHAVFQKYGHERINFYENDALNFLLTPCEQERLIL